MPCHFRFACQPFQQNKKLCVRCGLRSHFPRLFVFFFQIYAQFALQQVHVRIISLQNFVQIVQILLFLLCRQPQPVAVLQLHKFIQDSRVFYLTVFQRYRPVFPCGLRDKKESFKKGNGHIDPSVPPLRFGVHADLRSICGCINIFFGVNACRRPAVCHRNSGGSLIPADRKTQRVRRFPQGEHFDRFPVCRNFQRFHHMTFRIYLRGINRQRAVPKQRNRQQRSKQLFLHSRSLLKFL